MSVSYYNGSTVNGNSPFYRIKPVPFLNQTQGLFGNFQRVIPLVRAGQDRSFRVNSSSEIVLLSTSGTVIATVTSGSIFSGGYFNKLYLDSTDQCLYVLVNNSTGTQYQLAKIDDLTGAVTSLGSNVVPASAAKFGLSTNGATTTDFGFMDKPSSTTLRIIFDGYINIISKTDGTIISEGTEMVLGSYSPRGLNYINGDGDIGANFYLGQTADYDGMSLPSVTSVASGRIQSQSMELKVAPYSVFTTKAEGNFAGMIAIDNDKLAFVTLDAGVTIPTKFILRADWDRFLRTVVNYHAGIV